MSALWSLVLLAFTLTSMRPSSSSTCDASAWGRAIEAYVQAHPKAEAADLYKLAHQGIMGSEHAVTDTAAASAWMRREVATLSASPTPIVDSAMVESLPPDGRFVRVHLRPFLARGGDAAELVGAFVATANGARGDTAQFSCVERALSTMELKPLVNQLTSLIRERRHTGFDAVHHSAAFVAAYAPAYRVIRDSLMRQGTSY